MIYAVHLIFEHSAIVVVNAKSRKEAEKIATEAQFDSHPKKISEFDGDFGELIRVDEINPCSINEIKDRKS